MSWLLVYLLLLKATLTSFSGLASLPVIQADFVERHHLLTDRQLSTAVTAGRLGPGPAGIYIVSVGYLATGIPGAMAGFLAVITPAFLVIPLLHFLGRRAQHPRARSAIRAILGASAGLLAASLVPLAQDAVTGPIAGITAIASCILIASTRVNTLWIFLGAALLSLVTSSL